MKKFIICTLVATALQTSCGAEDWKNKLQELNPFNSNKVEQHQAIAYGVTGAGLATALLTKGGTRLLGLTTAGSAYFYTVMAKSSQLKIRAGLNELKDGNPEGATIIFETYKEEAEKAIQKNS